MWCESANGTWHASLQSTATEQFVHFADLSALIAFLIAQTGEPAGDVTTDPPAQAE
jgi:hypothetical protein